MVVLLAFWQCVLAFLMLSLRYIAGFGRLTRNLVWCVTLGRLGKREARAEDLTNDADVSQKNKKGDTQPVSLMNNLSTWYWFHLIAQGGFLWREVKVIVLIEGWYWEIVLANFSLLVVFLCTTVHIWQFSYLRNLKGVHHASVDRVVDMLMLPLNFGCLSAATVRSLRTQHSHRANLAQATLESGSVWQAWALWSLLKLFSRVVELATQDGAAMQAHGSTTNHESCKPGMDRKAAAEERSRSPSVGHGTCSRHSSVDFDSEAHARVTFPLYNKQRSRDLRDSSSSTSPAKSLVSPGLTRQSKCDRLRTISRAASPKSERRSGEQVVSHCSHFVRPMDPSALNPQSSDMDLASVEQDAGEKASRLSLAGPMESIVSAPTVAREGYEVPPVEGREPRPCWVRSVSDPLSSRALQTVTYAEVVDVPLPPSGSPHPKTDRASRVSNVHDCDRSDEVMPDAVPHVLGASTVTVAAAEAENTARLAAHSFVQTLTATQVVKVETTWRCIRPSGVRIRPQPVLNSIQNCVESLTYLEVFKVSEQLEIAGVSIIFLKLADGRGWVFDRDSEDLVCEIVEAKKLDTELQEGTKKLDETVLDTCDEKGLEAITFRELSSVIHEAKRWDVDTNEAKDLLFLGKKADNLLDVHNRASALRGRSRNSSDVDGSSQESVVDLGYGSPLHADPSLLASLDRESEYQVSRRGHDRRRRSSVVHGLHESHSAGSLPGRKRGNSFALHQSHSAGNLQEAVIKKEKKDVEGESHHAKKVGAAKEKYAGLVRNFGMVSESGVCTWVFGQLIINLFDVFIKGVIAQRFPTWCNYVLGTCMGCSQYYDEEYWPMIKGSLCLLSLTAVSFVLLSETVWSKEYLSKIPGRRSIKSKSIQIAIGVSYAQWLVLCYMLDLPRGEAYMWHGLLCCIEMGLLALWHFQIVYPFDDDKWMEVVLPSDPGHWPGLAALDRSLTGQGAGCDMLAMLLMIAIACYISGLIVCWFIPPDADVLPVYPMENMTCTESVSEAIKQNGNPMHIAVGMEQVTWLPLCDSMNLQCQPGYMGKPHTHCSYDRSLSIYGKCTVVGCGPPRPNIHAVAQVDPHRQDAVWTRGMHVLYKCELGYQGSPVAVCESDGTWSFVGTKCTIVGCGALQRFLEIYYEKRWERIMVPALNNATELKSSYDGQVVDFNCHKGLSGKPVATCMSGAWRLSDPCTASQTAKKCSCRQQWINCGGWLFNDCHRRFGCAIGTGSPYAWCQVSAGSCPASSRDFFGQEPFWDYCVRSEFNNTWPPEAAPSQGFNQLLGHIVLCVCFCAAAALFACCCFMGSKQASSRYLAGHPHLLHLCEAIRRIPGCFRRHWRIMFYTTEVRLERSVAKARVVMSEMRVKVDDIMSKVNARADSIKLNMHDRLEDFRQRIYATATEIMSMIRRVGPSAREAAEDVSTIIRVQAENIRSGTEDFGRRTSCSAKILLGNASVSVHNLVEQGTNACANAYESLPALPGARKSLSAPTRSQADSFSNSLVAPLMRSSTDTRSNRPSDLGLRRFSLQDWGRTIAGFVSTNRRTLDDTGLSSSLPYMAATIRRLPPSPDEVPACNLATVTKTRPPPLPRAKPAEPPRTLVAAAVTLQPPPLRADADALLATQPKTLNPRSTLFWR